MATAPPPQYYKLEVRALEGLLQGCEPRLRGRQPNSEQELARLQSANAKLERECMRLQSLVRLLGKTSAKGAKKGASGSRKAPKTGSEKAKTGKTRKRKRTIRALRLAAQMTDHCDEQLPSGQGSEPPKQAQPKVNGGTSWRDQ